MAYMNSLMNGAKLALMVSIMLTLTNGVYSRFMGETLEQAIDKRMPSFGGVQ